MQINFKNTKISNINRRYQDSRQRKSSKSLVCTCKRHDYANTTSNFLNIGETDLTTESLAELHAGSKSLHPSSVTTVISLLTVLYVAKGTVLFVPAIFFASLAHNMIQAQGQTNELYILLPT
ncbi:hypothetical protein HF086_009249 [Spodoptera exigua]|uniref:Uncharacterized protein n=1 Tax=Spodoptera exigua TaxID=7107 RepID=A0A922MDZ2_SPOEX|nr:hypothetical protein HF086_009249 [Spodoptera exigua]